MQRRRAATSNEPEQKTTAIVRQVVRASRKKAAETGPELKGDDSIMISTGSTLLDLAISGGRKRGGGIPGGIMVEIFGPHSSGKTIMLCEIAGDVQRKGGAVAFHDPEARLNMQFAKLFGLDPESIEYSKPNTVKELFDSVRSWEPKKPGPINGVFADSLAALSTDMEMDDKDAMGMRRGKEFSEGCRRTCRMLEDKNLLFVCSNQLRQNISEGGQSYGPKTQPPGGMAIGFYSSLRLKFGKAQNIDQKKTLRSGAVAVKTIGTETEVDVYKSSVWEGFHSASVIFLFGYGIDDVRANLKYIKEYTKATVYRVGGETVGKSINEAIAAVEEDELENKLKENVIDLWEEIEHEFTPNRRVKVR